MEKSADAFRTISEVSDYLKTPAHVLRFWESRFSQVKPVKRAGGRRYYRPSDVALISGIKKLLHEDGLTIRGVQKILKEQGVRHVAELTPEFLSSANGKAEPDTAVAQETPQAAPETPRDAPETAAAAASGPAERPDTSPGADRRAALDRQRQADREAPEAPMHVDVPPAEPAGSGDVLTLGADDKAGGPPPEGRAATDRGLPAAAMLRAMDTVRARDKKPELTSVYLRLVDLRERMVGNGNPSRD
ncbi:MAG: MerR family transcriptional regulator [Rhodobacteraceae bacterium]|nr:MerR family transcriptional regulator [Paracoccaceae bacterium]